jgi:Uncharacterised nucleotidyltransferase
LTIAARAIAAYGLRSECSLPREPLAAREFRELLDHCEQEGVLGLLGAAARDGEFPLDPAQHAELELEYRGSLGRALLVERLLLDAVLVLDRSRIESRVLGGVALAHTAYDDPSQRELDSLGLLVAERDLAAAVTALEDGLDARVVQAPPRSEHDSPIASRAMMSARGLELRLHGTVVDEMFAPPYRFPLGVTELETLPMPARLLYACRRPVRGGASLRAVWLRDLAQLVLRERPHVLDVLLMARSWDGEAVVARAVDTAWRELELVDRPPLVEWAARQDRR